MTMQNPSGQRGFGIYRAPDNTGRGGARAAVMRSPGNPYPPTQIRPERRVGLASPNRRASTECSAHWSFEACAAAIQSTLLPESWPPEPTASELRPVRPGHRIPEPVPWVCGNVYHMRMARVNITVPDELYDKARSAGLNVSRVAQDAIRAELARLGKIAELDAYLAELEVQQGPLGDSERAEARAWADGLFGPPAHSRSA